MPGTLTSGIPMLRELDPASLALVAVSIPAGLLAAFVVRRTADSPAAGWLPLVAGCLVVAFMSVMVVPQPWLAAATFALGWMLLMLATIDALVFRLPDILTLPLVAAGLLLSWWLPDTPLIAHAVGAAVGFLVFYAIAAIYRSVRGHEGLGFGDAKLVAAAGAWLGWAALPSMVLIACAAGFVWVGLAVVRRGRAALGEQIPFGVPLCFAFWIVWLFGPLGV